MLDGGGDADTILDGEGNDTLTGGDGDDTLLADVGDDPCWKGCRRRHGLRRFRH